MSTGVQVTEATVRELCGIAELAVQLAKAAGADAAEVLVRDGASSPRRSGSASPSSCRRPAAARSACA